MQFPVYVVLGPSPYGGWRVFAKYFDREKALAHVWRMQADNVPAMMRVWS